MTLITDEQIERFKKLGREHSSPAVKLTTIYLILGHENNTTEERFLGLCKDLHVPDDLTKVKNAVYNRNILGILVNNIENIFDTTEAYAIAYNIVKSIRVGRAPGS